MERTIIYTEGLTKMMIIFHPASGKMEIFKTEEALFKYIIATENTKLLEGHTHFSQTDWSFLNFSKDDVQDLYHNVRTSALTVPLKQAYAQELGLVEMSTGNFKHSTQIPLKSALDLKVLKKEWSIAYCKAHGYAVYVAREL